MHDVSIMQIHTASQSSPMQAYNQAVNDLDKELDHLKFELEVTLSFPLDHFLLQFGCDMVMISFIHCDNSVSAFSEQTKKKVLIDLNHYHHYHYVQILFLSRFTPILFRFCSYILKSSI